MLSGVTKTPLSHPFLGIRNIPPICIRLQAIQIFFVLRMGKVAASDLFGLRTFSVQTKSEAEYF